MDTEQNTPFMRYALLSALVFIVGVAVLVWLNTIEPEPDLQPVPTPTLIDTTDTPYVFPTLSE